MITSASNNDQTVEEDEDNVAEQHRFKRKGEENTTNAIDLKRSKPSPSDHPHGEGNENITEESTSALASNESNIDKTANQVQIPDKNESCIDLQEADSTINRTVNLGQTNKRKQPSTSRSNDESRNNDNQDAELEKSCN